MQTLSRIFSLFSRQAKTPIHKMGGINYYGRQLTEAEIASNVHREFVGGMWDEIGVLQFNFLKQRGLMPDHYLLDVGCGALRGGVWFVRYLAAGHYCGVDINASLIAAGKKELEKENLLGKHPHLLVNDRFEFSRFGITFDMAVAVSVFTHLPMNHIVRCLAEIRKVLNPGAEFFATFFEAPTAAHLEPITHTPGNIRTHFDADPFHYSFKEFQWMAQISNMHAELIGEWAHPRDQRMLSFRLRE
jgi:cyclopropane fatty-acyl-phospholipid synthase-like methyltransferase